MRTRQEDFTPKTTKRKKNKPSGGMDDETRVGPKPGLESSCVHIAQLFARQPEIAVELTRNLRKECAARVGVIRRAPW